MAKIFQRLGFLLIILLLILPSIAPFFRPGFFPTHDYIYVARVEQLDTALKGGHFPVRWAPDFRYGEALYNFYAPLPYYIGSLVHLLGPGYLTTTKILMALSLVLSVITMYFFTKNIFGKIPAMVSSILYLYAPYRSVDIYVRGALSESWAFVFLPLIFLFTYKIIKENKFKNIVFLSLSLAGLYYTHNIMTMMIAPFLVFWMLGLIFLEKKWLLSKGYLAALIISIGLGASYLLPAFFEKKFVQTQFLTLGYFDFRAHFVTLKQLVMPYWGYGASTWGDGDKLSLQVGLVNLLVVFLGLLSLFFYKKLTKLNFVFMAVFIISFFGSIFLQHNKSAFVWEIIGPLEFIQFPWRFMGISIFFASLIGGLLISFIKRNSLKLTISSLLIMLTMILNLNYFKPESYYLDSKDEHYISKEDILYRNDKVPKDYLPIWVKKLVNERYDSPIISQGNASVSDYQRKVTSAIFNVDVESESIIDIPIYYFPGWTVYVDKSIQKFVEPGDLGFIRVKLVPGQHQVKIVLKDTPLRFFSNFITLLTILFLLFWARKNNDK